jgi:hypothetical protein
MMKAIVNLGEFYGYTPSDVRGMTLRDVNALIQHMNKRRQEESERNRNA